MCANRLRVRLLLGLFRRFGEARETYRGAYAGAERVGRIRRQVVRLNGGRDERSVGHHAALFVGKDRRGRQVGALCRCLHTAVDRTIRNNRCGPRAVRRQGATAGFVVYHGLRILANRRAVIDCVVVYGRCPFQGANDS